MPQNTVKNFLRTKGLNIINSKGKKITLKGVNFGSWLLMEAYILGSPNNPEKSFKKQFRSKLGMSALEEFEKKFRDSFIKEADVENVAKLGFNCIRVPFNYRVVESSPYVYKSSGLQYLDNVIKWAKKYKIWIILDLHAAPGCQNHDWHGDSDGKADLWKNKQFQDRTVKIWEFLASRYKDNDTVVGYDLLNEAVLHDAKKLNSLYNRIIKAIRKFDVNHILFIEGNLWATNIKCLDSFDDKNYALSIHFYEPLDFTFNFVPHLKYPSGLKNNTWTKAVIKKHLSLYKVLSKKRSVPVFLGEFGVNTREGLYGEDKWVDDVLTECKVNGFHWTYWTYKAVKYWGFPDGVYSYKKNPLWVNRMGPKTGWDTYKDCWKKYKKEMIKEWDTACFDANSEIIKVLKKHVR